MMSSTSHREEQGQVIPPLLLAVVALLFLGLLVAQVGSAAEQKTQTRSVADSAAVAAAHDVRDTTIAASSHQIPHSWAPAIFAAIPILTPALAEVGCDAAQRNWTSNPHDSGLSCGDVSVSRTTGGARVSVTAPAGEGFEGPADATGQRARATAVTRVVLDECPLMAGVPGALAHWIADRTMAQLGRPSSCYTPADEASLEPLDLYPWTAPAAVGPPNLIVDAVRRQMRIEIIQ